MFPRLTRRTGSTTQVGRVEVMAFQSVEAGYSGYTEPITIKDDEVGHVELPAYDASAAAGGYIRKGIPITIIPGEPPTTAPRGMPLTEALRYVRGGAGSRSAYVLGPCLIKARKARGTDFFSGVWCMRNPDIRSLPSFPFSFR